MDSIPGIAFKTALGINGLTVVVVAWVLKGTVKPKQRERARAFAARVAIIVVALIVTLSLSLFLSKWLG